MPLQRKPTTHKPTINKPTNLQVSNFAEPWNAVFNSEPNSRTEVNQLEAKRKHRNYITNTLIMLILLTVTFLSLNIIMSN